MVNIFEYTDYRLFLKDFYLYRREKRSSFSYRFIAEKVGFKSAGHFTQILKGQANISNHLVNRFAKFMKLKKREFEYFELLVNFNQAKTQEEKASYFERIINFKEVKAKVLSPDQYEFYQKWYYAVVRDMLSLYKFTGNFRELAKQIHPSISALEAERAIKLLLKLNLITVDDYGTYKAVEPFLSSPMTGEAVVLSGYAMQMIDRGKEAINLLPKEERLISWAGFSVSEETYNLIVEEIRASRKRILTLVEKCAKPDRVYHFNTQLFPVSKRYKK